MALDHVNHRLFVGCRGGAPVLAVLDSRSGELVATQEIGRGNDGVAYDAETHLIYATNGIDGNLIVIRQADPDSYALAAATTTRPMARTLAFDSKHKKIFTIAAEGVADPSAMINRSASHFYPNRYFDDTLTLLTYSIMPVGD